MKHTETITWWLSLPPELFLGVLGYFLCVHNDFKTNAQDLPETVLGRACTTEEGIKILGRLVLHKWDSNCVNDAL